MPAPTGNTNALKWTQETVMQKLDELEKAVEHTVYIGEGLSTIGLYAEWFAYITETFKDDDIVFKAIKRIEQAYEAKLVKKTLNGDFNPTMAIFTLKNKHKWKDQSQVDNNVSFVNWNEQKTYEAKPQTNSGS
jgi:hypothetical protein